MQTVSAWVPRQISEAVSEVTESNEGALDSAVFKPLQMAFLHQNCNHCGIKGFLLLLLLFIYFLRIALLAFQNVLQVF